LKEWNKISYEDIVQEKEKPSIFLIISQEGTISFSENFGSAYLTEGLENQIMETISNMKIAENHSIGFIERTRINGYNVIFRELDRVKLCYVFMGKSYSAINKFRVLLQEFDNSINIWSDLNDKILKQKNIDLNDRVRLSNYMQKMFVE